MPIAEAGPNQTVNINVPVTLDGSASSDPGGHLPLTYHWTQTGGPAVILSDNTLSVTTFTAPGVPTVLTFTLTVTNSLGEASDPPAQTSVTVQDIPIVNLTATNSSPMPLHEVTTLTATIDAGSHVNYAWDFGDDSALAFDHVVTHTYGSFGNFTATVTATNSSDSQTATTPVVIVPPYQTFLPLILKD